MFPEDLSFTELVNLEHWQKIQDSFSDALELTLRTVSLEDTLLTETSRPNCICNGILPKLSSRSKFCGNCLLNFDAKDTVDIKDRASFKCPLGLDAFVVPIKAVGNRIIAYIVIGPLILKNRRATSEYAKAARELGIKVEELTDALIEINVFTYNKIYSITNAVERIFSHIAQTGYHKRRLGEIAPDILKMDPLFSRYYEEKVLNALLKACSIALDADSGSVMTLDKKTHILNIKVSTKIDKDIVDNTNIKVGEGIAGLAAATSEPIILPQDENKNGLSEKMKRKDIKSSMIVPFNNVSNKENGHDVYGVINLNVVRKEKDFSKKDVTLVKELINIASVALGVIQQASSDSSK